MRVGSVVLPPIKELDGTYEDLYGTFARIGTGKQIAEWTGSEYKIVWPEN